jgi:hypothetical protein
LTYLTTLLDILDVHDVLDMLDEGGLGDVRNAVGLVPLSASNFP